ncbi:hypothetical protein K503DRAFT_775307 [Rhizopogon vinicolor AM-OR11-026]|uniref:WW domain-containing protein n=1 Tax=Rhizopogon vinicolor AM-OR11-026 TaxID=1314800 RepID=A0A1B7MM56_9AGAM|nr:hypothetical protein K503DRAFT_775307 [Rhizopogon vinicolor AM-OR11-026]
MSGGCIRMFISWLNLIFRKTTFRSYKILLAVLRLFRYCQVLSNGKDRAFRERDLVAMSSQPAELTTPATVTLAVQSEGAEPVNEWSNVTTFSAQAPQNLIASSISMPLPCTYPAPPQPATPGQLDIDLTPIIPEEIKRYDRNIFISDTNLMFKVEKGPLNCSEEDAPVNAWESLTHPEGALFFYHPHKRVFTDLDVRDREIANKVDRAADMAYEKARNALGAGANIYPHPSVELALEIMDNDKNLGYYFADHGKHVIFWYEDHESSALINNVRGVKRKSHVSQCFHVMKHVELFPNKRFLPEDVVVKLNEIVMHAQAENITSDSCLAPFGPDEVASMLTLMDPLTKSVNSKREHSVWIVGNAKFVNFCGQPGARLEADQSLYENPESRQKNFILRVMNLILFGSPDAYSKAIHGIWVDRTIVQPRWKNFIDRLNSEWNGYTIFSTVMLAVDISFLAVPNVQYQTAAVLVAYLSTLCAMGSLVVSLVLAGQVNDTRRNKAAEVASFMVQMTRSTHGLESLALMLSLPFALLIWGMTFFGAALSIVIFNTSGTATISIVFPIWVAILILATWPVLAANDIHPTALRGWIIDRVSHQGGLGTGSSV